MRIVTFTDIPIRDARACQAWHWHIVSSSAQIVSAAMESVCPASDGL